ncbi:MAG: amidase family protein [Proteobacteria bacterium]|nr:amidase family protein [Pseudomonadota bacterium]
MTDAIWAWSARQTARAVRAREVSAVEVLRSHLARLDAANPAVNAVVRDLRREALAAARAIDRALARREPLGPLAGVPVTVKENVDVRGWPNPNGVPAQLSLIAPDDAPVVANLRRAGAVVFGLTNTPEFSLRGFTDNPLHGLTLNPWDPSITCGGSSGGAGAAVALGIGAIAHGNDIGGSLRWPAHCNGIATIRPTQGRVPAYNPSAPSERPLAAQLMSVQGPLAREVRDVELALQAMSARDPRDPWWVPAPLKGPPVAKPVRVALARLPADQVVDADTVACLGQAARHLEDAGYAVEEAVLPDLDGTWQLWADLLATEIALLQEAQMNAVGSPPFRQALAGLRVLARPLDAPGYMRALAERTRRLREWLLFLERYPLVLTPTTVRPTPGPRADLGGDAALREIFHNDLRFVSAINVLGLPAAVVPAGLLRGQPVGVQIIASRYREDLCLAAARAIERRVGILTRRLWAREAAPQARRR